MTDRDVLTEVERTKRALHRSLTRAEHQRHVERCFCVARWKRDDDVERAALDCELRRIEARYASAVDRARERCASRLDKLRDQAGEWQDLVPNYSHVRAA
jgi:hypothetical protein